MRWIDSTPVTKAMIVRYGPVVVGCAVRTIQDERPLFIAFHLDGHLHHVLNRLDRVAPAARAIAREGKMPFFNPLTLALSRVDNT